MAGIHNKQRTTADANIRNLRIHSMNRSDFMMLNPASPTKVPAQPDSNYRRIHPKTTQIGNDT